jgi:hypothetical protein
MKNNNKKPLKKTSFYIDKAIAEAALKKTGKDNISVLLRECLEDITDKEVVRIKVTKDTKEKLVSLMKYPNSEKIIEETFKEVLNKSKEKIQKEVGKLW